MQLFAIVASALTLATTVVAMPAGLETRGTSTVQVTWDSVYDNGSNSLDIVSCSNGPNGLETKGFKTFGDLPDFPYIGGAQAVAGFNSPNCGSCWQLTYKNTTINVLAIDHAGSGFNIAKAAMDTLTDGQAVQVGVVQATSKEVAPSVCGL
ncbi:cerato-platanin-like secreted protein [Ganoderma leucocontextum]|nr:cerato-platanin-like secreted protein [Ganoderma leucocontextum]